MHSASSSFPSSEKRRRRRTRDGRKRGNTFFFSPIARLRTCTNRRNCRRKRGVTNRGERKRRLPRRDTIRLKGGEMPGAKDAAPPRVSLRLCVNDISTCPPLPWKKRKICRGRKEHKQRLFSPPFPLSIWRRGAIIFRRCVLLPPTNLLFSRDEALRNAGEMHTDEEGQVKYAAASLRESLPHCCCPPSPPELPKAQRDCHHHHSSLLMLSRQIPTSR